MHDTELMVGNFYCLVAQRCNEASKKIMATQTVSEPIAILLLAQIIIIARVLPNWNGTMRIFETVYWLLYQ